LYQETSLALWISQILLLIFKPTHKLVSAIGVHTRTIIFTHSAKKKVLHLSFAGKAKGRQNPVPYKKQSLQATTGTDL
jgi:hypothetical protein